MPTHPLLPTALQSTPFTYFAFCFSFLLFNDFPTDKLCSKYWEARSTYSTVHWAHCSLSVPEQMEVGLQSCSSQDSSVTMCESHDISSAFLLTNLCASHFYFLFFFLLIWSLVLWKILFCWRLIFSAIFWMQMQTQCLFTLRTRIKYFVIINTGRVE